MVSFELICLMACVDWRHPRLFGGVHQHSGHLVLGGKLFSPVIVTPVSSIKLALAVL